MTIALPNYSRPQAMNWGKTAETLTPQTVSSADFRLVTHAPDTYLEEDQLRRLIEQTSPSAEELKSWARDPRNHPPQEWWDNEESPFTVDG